MSSCLVTKTAHTIFSTMKKPAVRGFGKLFKS